jgi:BASS family bile acid:Na+ symporter
MNIITQVLLPLILAFIMFSMGLDLVMADFKRVAKFPKAFVLGFVLQFLTLPIIAFLLAKYFTQFGLTPEFAVGLIIIAACPGGVTSNMMTHLAKGDIALSISLTAITSIVSVLTLPFIVNYGLTTFMPQHSNTSLPILKTVTGIFLITTIPVLIGMFFRFKKHDLVIKISPIIKKIASFLFVALIAAAILKDWSLLVDNITKVGPSVLLLNLIAMMIAFVSARIFKLNLSQSTAITYECGFQNGTLAIFIAVTLLGNHQMMLPAGVYSIFMFLSATVYFVLLQLFTSKTVDGDRFGAKEE